jgi:hypothetical protein
LLQQRFLPKSLAELDLMRSVEMLEVQRTLRKRPKKQNAPMLGAYSSTRISVSQIKDLSRAIFTFSKLFFYFRVFNHLERPYFPLAGSVKPFDKQFFDDIA